MKHTLISALCLFLAILAQAQGSRSIQQYGVLPTNTPQQNRAALQRAIDWATNVGGELVVEPSEQGYPIATGIRLRRNVTLRGVHGPTGRGTCHPKEKHPVGSVFIITDTDQPFITVESGSQIRGIQFYYPNQTYNDASRIIAYKPTIQVAQDQSVFGVTLSCLTFYGEYMAMDFNSKDPFINEQILFEHCYGYPLGGEFIRIDRCYDIPRILHCHVNPANQRLFGRDFNRAIIDAVVARHTFTYHIDHTDNAQLMDLFTFGAYGGIYLGSNTYGQLTNFNLDCVTVGLYKTGSNTKNRNWQIAQGSIIANTGASLSDIHPIIIEGQGHTALSNVEAFSGDNGALTCIGQSQDFLLVRGQQPLTISLSGCRMRNYSSSQPITRTNPKAVIQAVGCLDKDEKPFNLSK